jgi:phosphohistidine phosphatase SixA
MVVAHNPGTAYLVSTLADKSMDMPTAAIAIFQYSLSDWIEVDSSRAELIAQMRPKAL